MGPHGAPMWLIPENFQLFHHHQPCVAIRCLSQGPVEPIFSSSSAMCGHHVSQFGLICFILIRFSKQWFQLGDLPHLPGVGNPGSVLHGMLRFRRIRRIRFRTPRSPKIEYSVLDLAPWTGKMMPNLSLILNKPTLTPLKVGPVKSRSL